MKTTTMCADCHATSTWNPYTQVNHADVIGVCTTCHANAAGTSLTLDGVTVQGRPSNAVHTNTSTLAMACDACHSTTTWTTSTFNHTGITTGCASCHNGTLATGRPADTFHVKVKTTAACETCHVSTLAWTPVNTIDHTQLTTTTPCSSCHNGTIANAKPADTIHNQTTTDCVNCHTTTSWIVTTFDHTGFTGACNSCHNGTTAVGKSTGHFLTTRDCGYCHNTTAWTTLTFKHQSANFTMNKLDTHAQWPTMAANCGAYCHPGNAEATPYLSTGVAYAPYCAACHVAQWSASAHKSHVPNTLISHENCSSVCHSATSTIPVQHKVSASSFSN